MAALDKVCMFFRIANINTHRLVPTIGDRNKMRIDGRPETCKKTRQRIAEIFVLSLPKAMACHHHLAAEDVVLPVEAGYRPAFVWRKKILDHCTTLCVEVLGNLLPGDRVDPLRNAFLPIRGRSGRHCPG